MKNKTAIEELIEKMYESYNWKHSTFQEKAGIASCINKAKRMLEKEKKQILDAHQDGFYNGQDYAKTGKGEFKDSNHYYNEKFN